MNYVTRLTKLVAASGLVVSSIALAADEELPTKQLSGSTPQPLTYQGPMAASVSPSSNRFTIQADSPFAQTGNFSVDAQDRQHVQAFFNSIYTASEKTPLVFDGMVSACSPGTTNNLFKDAVRLRINWFRELAGVNDTISFRGSYSESAQDAALIMAANGLLTHTPSNTLDCFTSTGADGAGSSNLALGTLGWDSITGYMEDSGSNNAAVGHRRWLLHPPIEEMGTGDIPSTSNSPATNAVWVFDDNIFSTGPTRDGYVAWPPPAFVPHNVVPARWSFSLANANFTNTTVSMTRNGAPISAVLEPLSQGAGLNSVVWIPLGLNAAAGEPWPTPTSDEVLSVTLDNVLVNGSPQSFSYDVQIFDPVVAGGNDVLTVIAGPNLAELATAERFSFQTTNFAQSYNLREGQLTALSATEGAEGSNSDIIDGTDSSYPLFSTDAAANGSSSFHLAHPTASDQDFVWNKQIRPSASSELQFFSRLGFASPTQVARAQVSLDDGQNWRDVFSQEGSNGSGESGFTQRSVSLAEFADEVIMVRFAYDLLGGSFFPQSSANVGLYIDDISVTNAQELTDIQVTALGNNNEFSYLPESAGDHLLQVQSVGWEGFNGSAWGPGQAISVSATSNATTAVAASVLPASRSVFQTTATAFATMINGGTEVATGCRIVPQTNTPISFSYQTTNPADNSLTGTRDTPADIAPGAVQTFALFLEPSAAFAPTEIALSFDCANTAPAPVFSGLNTLLLASGAGPVPDLVALAAAGSSGIVDIPGNTGTGVFAVATVNAGATGEITASASAPGGVTISVCQTVPATGACMASPAATVTTTVASNETPTFGFFVTGNGNVPFDPANNRAVVTFTDAGGVTRGATSVAIRTN